MATKRKKKTTPLAVRLLAEKLLLALTAKYGRDGSAPGLVLSALPDGRFYASIVRYFERYGNGKQVVCNTYGDTLDEVVINLARQWTGETEARVALVKALRGLK